MTAIVGVLCRDGLVIGADSSATSVAGTNFRVMEQPTQKIDICSGTTIIAGTGSVGLGQRFCRIIEVAHGQNLFGGPSHYVDIGKELCRRAITDFGQTGLAPGQYAALVGFPLGDKIHLCEFALSDFQPEFKTEKLWYASIGGGQPITDPFLAFMREVFWVAGPPTVQDAIFAVTWALDHAVRINPGGINGPIHIAVLEKHNGNFQARLLNNGELEEHYENIRQAKERLRTFPASQSADAPDTPEIPKP
jgi:20S proteasome alpha/beta subunit